MNRKGLKVEQYFRGFFACLFQMAGPPQPGYPQAPGVSMPSGPGAQQPTYQVKQDSQKITTFSRFFFSSPEPKAQGELIVWDSSRRPCVRPCVCPHFQT